MPAWALNRLSINISPVKQPETNYKITFIVSNSQISGNKLNHI